MVILGMVYYCFNHITIEITKIGTPLFHELAQRQFLMPLSFGTKRRLLNFKRSKASISRGRYVGLTCLQLKCESPTQIGTVAI